MQSQDLRCRIVLLGNMCIAVVCLPDCTAMDFEINLIFLIEPLFLQDQNVTTKT